MEINAQSVIFTLALLGTGTYMAYMIEKRRIDIRRTIQVIELKDDEEFWRDLTEIRDLMPVRP
jgi:hypothetical protein